ncbi:MAG: FAD-dependent oxidoreductase [Dethiobacter sp.]|nr:FAD-dependent oxidoreductase [Dethiobacter sp.]
MGSVAVIGGGWAGCSAALTAARLGAQVILLERADMLLGTGLVGGIYRNNGRLTAILEAEELGFGQLFAAMDSVARHHNLRFPGHEHASLYDVTLIEPLVRELLLLSGVEVRLRARAVDVTLAEGRLLKVAVGKGEELAADAFVEATGTAGGMTQCSRFGHGCAMCIIRCPSFGSRVSIAGKAGLEEVMGLGIDGTPGAMSGSCKLQKESLAPPLREQLEKEGVLIIPLPAALRRGNERDKVCQQYNLPAFKENLVILDTGHAKMMVPYFPLDELRQVPGLDTSRYADPYAGGVGNSIRFTSITPRDDRLKVEGLGNLFCAGEKAGFLVGHTEAVVTGALAGYNAAALSLGRELLILPETLACGDIIAFANIGGGGLEQRSRRITFSGSQYFVRMKELGLYSADRAAVRRRVARTGLQSVFAG